MTEHMTTPQLHVTFRARLGDNAEIAISGSDVKLVSEALVHFGLGTPQQPAAAPAPVEKTPADVAEKLAKKVRAKKEAAAEPVEKPAQEAAPIETPPAVSSEPAPAPATAAEEPAAVAPSATPEDAAAAVKAYGAKHGIDAARALLQQFGFSRTGDITADKAAAVVEAASV